MRTALLLVALLAAVVLGDRTEYYRMVEDISQGKNYYNILGVDPDIPSSELRKVYRDKALTQHPDKDKSPGAAERWVEIVNAYEILYNDALRAQYNELLDEGVPLHELYYGQYAHKFGAPDHDIRYVLGWAFAICTAIKHFIDWQNYSSLMSGVRTTTEYKSRVNSKVSSDASPVFVGTSCFFFCFISIVQYSELLAQKLGESAPGKRRKKLTEEEERELRQAAESLVSVNVVGVRKPNFWRDNFVLYAFKSVFRIFHAFFSIGRHILLYNVLGRVMTKQEIELARERDLRERLFLTETPDAEWKEIYAKHLRDEEASRVSARGKQMRRWMKKGMGDTVVEFDFE
eukprot:TRINITY_DN4003_c0_g1_i4.p1 TRINITY_DN4003_c0_g1~~TRINITY_DN4003_c0_g1_i4.p1  ORF type:complete len:345 (+),score=77.94 TRINITY_DN4003_c0_g1_i4:1-1035(+)